MKTVRELIEALSGLDPNATVWAVNPDCCGCSSMNNVIIDADENGVEILGSYGGS